MMHSSRPIKYPVRQPPAPKPEPEEPRDDGVIEAAVVRVEFITVRLRGRTFALSPEEAGELRKSLSAAIRDQKRSGVPRQGAT
jgi:hypothetical protein